MTELIIGAIILFIIIYFVNQSNEKQRKIEDEKKRLEKVKQQAELQKRQEEEKRQRQIQERKNEEQRKLSEAKPLEKERLQKIEDEKYETLKIVVVGQRDDKFTCVLERQNKTYAYVERPNTAFQLDSNLKLLKETANKFEWISQIDHNKKQEKNKLELQRQEEEQRQREFQAIENAQRNFCEANTSYTTDLHNIYTRNPRSFGLTTIKSLSNPFYNSITEAEQNKIFAELNQGVAILQTEGLLFIYIRSYGNMHQAKLLQSFDTIPNLANEINRQDIQIIDYGCGQGIGSVVFIDFLKLIQATNYTISKIKLIEPSEKALKRASINSKYSLKSINQNENVLAIHKTIEQINEQDLSTNPTSIKFHIFSNILDVDDFGIATLAQKISNSQSGVNYFICVSPKFYEDGNHPRNIRLNTFMNYFQQRNNVSVLSRRETNINNWKRYERVFKAVC